MKQIYLILSLLLFCIVMKAQSPHAAQLYGMTQYGGADHKGILFHYTPSTKTITVDHEFKVKVKGKSPKCDVVAPGNGKYYGTTTSGGANDAGVIFEWDSVTSAYKEVYDFNGADGQDARGGMQLYNGKLYGMTNLGGAFGYGVIYEWDYTNNTYTKKYDMDSINGKNPDGSLLLVGNLFYGFAREGGTNNKGVIFEWNPATNIYTKKYDFDGTKGANPIGKFAGYNGKLYAMTNTGGINNLGVIYEWNYTTNVVTKKIDFNGTNGQHPIGGLTFYNTKFYGMTYEGGIYEMPSPYDHYGVIFEWNPVTNVYVKKKDLGANANNSRAPLGSFTVVNTKLWAITSEGLGNGTIFEWTPATNILINRYANNQRPFLNEASCEEYGYAIGWQSYTTLLLQGNRLLGTSSKDAGGYEGCLFEYSIDSNQVTRSVHMQATDGSFPNGSLTRLGNKLFGCTYQGGDNHAGNIFEWDLDSLQYKQRFEFNGYNTGIKPKGNLTLYNGKFYGINSYNKFTYTSSYSSFVNRGLGEFFSWDPITNSYQSLYKGFYTASSFKLYNNKLFFTSIGAFPYSNTIGYGAILTFNPSTNTVDTVAILPNAEGSFQNYQDQESGNNITYYNGKYYGLTPAKGHSGNIPFKGSIYEWDSTSNFTTNKFDFVDSTGVYPTGNMIQVGNALYGLTSGANIVGSSLFKYDPITNTVDIKTNIGGTGTPVYSEGKFYYLYNTPYPYPSLMEYDPALDTLNAYPLPTYTDNGNPFGWFNFVCSVNDFPELLEVIPNKKPILITTPQPQTTCSNQTDTAQFIITDADADTMSFQITSSNIALLPIQNIAITNVDSLYTITYLPLPNQIGASVITVIANDGYGGSLNFSFTINVLALPISTITPMGPTTFCQGDSVILVSSSGGSYLWNTNAISSSITVSTSGNYFVIVTDGNGCSKTSAVMPVTMNPAPIAGIVQTTNVLTANPTNATYQWIDCAANTDISGATNISFTPTANGLYAVIVTNANNCIDTSACLNYLFTSLPSSNTGSGISFYPNPASTELQIISDEHILSIQIVNALGQELASSTTKRIDIAFLSPGTYFIVTQTDKGIWREKFVKE